MMALCENSDEFVEVLRSLGSLSDYNFERRRSAGFLVTSRVRREFLVSEHQGKLAINGWIYDINFDNKGGGVWHAWF